MAPLLAEKHDIRRLHISTVIEMGVPFQASSHWELLNGTLADLIAGGRCIDGDLDRYMVTNIPAPTMVDAVWEALRRARLDGVLS